MPNSITQMRNLLGRDRELMPNLLGMQAQAGTTVTKIGKRLVIHLVYIVHRTCAQPLRYSVYIIIR